MKRSTPLKRTGFKRKEYVPKEAEPRAKQVLKPLDPTVAARVRVARADGWAKAVEKSRPQRSEKYRRAVAALPCICCGVVGYSQAAHPNTGKGMGVKADDMLCFPLCADRPGVRGCHSLFDQGAMFSKEVRREKEIAWALDTKAVLSCLGGCL